MSGNSTAQPNHTANGRTIALLAAITLLGAALRLHGLAESSIWYDEGFALAHVSKMDCSLHSFSPDLTNDAPLMAILLFVWQKCLALFPRLAPGSYAYDWMLRLVPCLFSIAAIPLAYGAARLILADITAALVAAFLTAISPYQVFYAHEIRPYSLYLALALVTLVVALDALERDRRGSWLALPFVMSLTFYSHFFAAWHVATLNLFFLLCVWRYRRHFWRWAAVQLIFVVLCSPALLQAAKTSAIFESIQNVYTIRPGFLSGFITFKTFFAGYGPRVAVYYTLFAAGGAAFLAGLWALRRRPHALALVVCLTVVPIAGNVLFWRFRHFPMYEHRLFIVASILVFIVVSLALTRPQSRWLRIGAVSVFAVLMIPGLTDYYHQRLHPSMTHRMGVRYKVPSREAAAYIAARLRPGDIVAHASHFTYFPFRYYLSGTPVGQVNLRLTEAERQGFLGALPKQALWDAYGAIPVRIEDATRSASRVWWVKSWWEPFAIPPHVTAMQGWLDGHFRRTDVQCLDGLTISLYERGHQRTERELGDSEGEWGIAYDAGKSALAIDNRGVTPRVLEGTMTTSTYVIEPNEFSRADTGCDTWHLWFECLPEREPVPTNAFAMEAELSGEKGAGAAVYKDIAPAQGRYAVFLRTFNDCDAVNKYRANLVLHAGRTGQDGDAATVGRIIGNDPSVAVGWGWRLAGTVDAEGSPIRLTVTVHNDDRLTRAYADFGRLVFIRLAPGETAPQTPELERFKLEVAPGSSKSQALAPATALQGKGRIDVDVLDAAAHEYRHVFFPTGDAR